MVPLSREQLAASYDQVARKYEARFLGELQEKARDRHLLEAFAASVGDVVVDVGCGPGHISAFVRQHGRTVIGVDLSFEMARLAIGRLDSSMVAHMCSLPLSGGQVGGLLAFFSLIHLPRAELGAALAECHRVLRPGGRILFTVHEGSGEVHVDNFLDEHVPFAATLFELEELVGACHSAGLQITNVERMPPRPVEFQAFRLYVEAERQEENPS